MEGNWDVLERVDLLGLIITLHVQEQSLLIAEMPVVLQVVVGDEGRTPLVAFDLVAGEGAQVPLLQDGLDRLEILHVFLAEDPP